MRAADRHGRHAVVSQPGSRMMRPPPPVSPPENADELLRCLRGARLVSARRARLLARRWAAGPQPGGCEARVRELLCEGVLTRYQAAQVLAGRARRLRLGPYRVLDRLGIGGMGQVYKAEHILMRRVVALKVVARLPRTDSARDTPPPGGQPSRRDLLARFRSEARWAGRMSHPNVVTAFDAGVARGFLFLVMEYVEGIDLGRFVAEYGPLPVPLACEAVRQAALALQYAHDRGLVHRDVKPDNLLFTWRGAAESASVGSLPSLPDGTSGEGAAFVKLLDLGLALPSSLAPELAERAGTPDFMAPEFAHEHGPIDARSDLYSLGCTFYFLLTGSVPYPGGSYAEKLLRHGLDCPAAVTNLRPDVPPAVAAVVQRLMEKKPEDRYSKPADVASVLRGLAEQGWKMGAPPPVCPSAHPGAPRNEAEEPSRAAEYVGPTARDLLDQAANDTPSLPSFPELPMPQVVAPSTRRRRLPGLRAVTLAALLGPLLVLATRVLPMLSSRPAEVEPAPRAPSPFRIERLDQEFATLAEAIKASSDGDVITVRGAGPHRLPPTDLGSKALTLSAPGGDRPQLEPKHPEADAPWQPLFAAAAALTLEGVDLTTSGDAPLVASTGATLRLTDCRLAATGGGPAVVVRGSVLQLQSCRVRAVSTAIAIEVDGNPCTVDLAGNDIAVSDPAGVGVAVWAPEGSGPADASLALDRNAICSGRVASVRAMPGRLKVAATANEFTFRDALISFSGYADNAAWRRSTAWKGSDNRCQAAGYWIQADGRPVDVRDAAGWQRLWADPAAVATVDH
jgi:eukaryotic-like serine/threonine-protein kinase